MLSSAQLEQARRLRAARIAAARAHPAALCAYVVKTDAGEPAIPSRCHVEWLTLALHHRRVNLLAPPEVAKSRFLACGYLLWVLGTDPRAHILMAAATAAPAYKNVALIRHYIERSEELHEVFPNLRPGKPWRDDILTVAAAGVQKDPSLQAVGVGTNFRGARLTHVVLDDIVTWDNCLTPPLRDKTANWYDNNVIDRMVDKASVIAINNCEHEDDLPHRWMKPEFRDLWVSRAYPILNDRGESLWPDVWPRLRIEKRRAELGLPLFDRKMLLRARDDATAVIKRDWIEACLARGQGIGLVPRLDSVPDGATVWHGMDLGFSADGDLNALVTLLRYPSGVILPLSVESGHWPLAEKRHRIIAAHARYGGTVIVESNVAQGMLVEHLNEEHPEIPVRGAMTTGPSKRDAIDRLCALMAMGRLPLPNHGGSMHPEVKDLVSDIQYFDPKGHTGDRMMGLLLALSGAATMGTPARDIEVMFV